MPASFSVTPTDKAARRKLAPKAKKRKPAIVSERAAENTAKRVNATARRHDAAERVRGARNRADAAPAPKTLRQTAAVISLRDKKGTLKEKTARVAEAEKSGAIPKHKGTKRPPLRSTGPTRATKRKEGVFEQLSSVPGLGGLGSIEGADIARTVAHTVGATAESIARDPVKQLGLAAKQAKDIAKGSAQLLALPYIVPKEALHGKATTLKKLAGGMKEDFEDRYGAAVRGDEGAYRTQVNRQRKEGSLAEIMDLATGAAPTVSLGASGARQVARSASAPSIIRAVARATESRPVLREGAGVGRRAAKQQRARPTLAGAAAAVATDKARRAVQKRRVKQADAGTKPLTPRRVATQEGEVTPIFDRLADVRAARRTVVDAGRRRTDAALTKRRELTNRKKSRGGTESLRATFDKLPAEKRTAALYALQLGIRDAESAEALLSQRAVDIQAERANEPPEIAAARRNDELPVIAELARNPAIFNDPEVRAAADAELARGGRMTGEGSAISPERAAAANAAPLGRTLGVERVESSAPSGDPIPKAEHRAIINAAKKSHTAALKDLDRAEREHTKARAKFAHAKGRAEILSRNVGDTAAERKAAGRTVPAGERQYEGGGLAVTRAADELQESFARVSAAKESVKATRKDLAEANRPKRSEPVLGETGAEFAARVREERKSVPGTTAEPGYYPSRYDAPQDVPLTASRAQLAGVGTRHREGVLYDQGRELKDPELLLRAHARNIDNYARQATRSDVLEREGIPYATREDAEKALADSGMAGKAIVVSADGAVLKGARTANIVDGRELPELDARADLGDFAPTTAHYIIPTTVQKELDALHKPISAGGRVLDRIQHLTQAVMLGASPSWLQFQTIADTVALTAQGITPAQAIRATREYNALTDAGRQQVDVLVGGNPSSDLLRGSEDLGRTAAILASNPTYRKHFSGRKNPLTALLRADAQRTAGARRIALITKLERDAKTARIDKEIGDLRPLQRKLTRALGQQEPGELQRLLNDGDLAEQAAEHVAKIMGDFTSYTQAERAAMKRFIPFYGFLRYSLKLAFHTLPVDHPYVALLIAQVGQLTAEESRDIVGNELPQGISRLYTNNGEKMVDFARAHPILNGIVAAETSNQFVTAFMPPLAVIAANYAFKQNLWLGREYKVKNRTQGTKDLAGEERLRIVADELFKLLGPYKALKELPNEPQGDDSLPWSRRPLRPTDTKTIISTRETTAAREKQGGLKRAALKLFPLAAPEQPTQDRKIGEGKTRRKLEREQEKIDSEERRDYKLNDPLQQMKMEAEIQKMMRRQELGLPDAAAERKARRRELGLPPEVR